MQPVSPCFTPGTLIATEHGQRPVEDLRRGDRLVTRDNGLKRIMWAGRKTLSYGELQDGQGPQPVLVRAGAFGDNTPSRDMIVSPQHRFLVGPRISPLMGGKEEALISAKHLLNGKQVTNVSMLGVSYIHVLCNAHEVILADGAWTESFHPDDQIIRDIAPMQRREILSVFPEIETIGAARRFSPARPIRKSRFEI